MRRFTFLALSLCLIAAPARAEDPDTLLRALMEYFPAAAGSAGVMATSTLTFGTRAYTYYADLKSLEKLVNENEPLFRKNLAQIRESFEKLDGIYQRFHDLSRILPKEKRNLGNLERLVRQHGFEKLAAHPMVGPEWVQQYHELRGNERAYKQQLATSWNTVLETAKELGESKVHRLTEARADSLLQQIQGPLNEIALSRPLNDPDGNEPLGKLVRPLGDGSQLVGIQDLAQTEFRGLEKSCRHALAGIQGMRRGASARRSRMKLYAGLSAGSGITTLALGAAWLYMRYNPLDTPNPGAEQEEKSSKTPIAQPTIGLDELKEANLDFAPAPPPLPKSTEVGRAGETTEKIAERRTKQPEPDPEDNTSSGIAKRRRNKP